MTQHDDDNIRQLPALPRPEGQWIVNGKDVLSALKGITGNTGVVFANTVVNATRLRQYMRLAKNEALLITPGNIDDTGPLTVQFGRHTTHFAWNHRLAGRGIDAFLQFQSTVPLADGPPAAAPLPPAAPPEPKPDVVKPKHKRTPQIEQTPEELWRDRQAIEKVFETNGVQVNPEPASPKPARKAKTPAMSAREATRFDRTSTANYQIVALAAAARGCHCEPYVDWFTYHRWLAQDIQVQKGEPGTKLTTWIPITKTDKITGEKVVTGKRPKSTSVFCRCQVAAC